MLLKHCQFMHSTLQGACRNRTVTRPFNQPRDTDNKTTTQSPNRTYLLGQARAKTVFGAEASTGGRGVVSLMAAEDGTVDVPKRVEEGALRLCSVNRCCPHLCCRCCWQQLLLFLRVVAGACALAALKECSLGCPPTAAACRPLASCCLCLVMCLQGHMHCFPRQGTNHARPVTLPLFPLQLSSTG